MLKNSKSRKVSGSCFFIIKVYSLNLNSVNSILKKFKFISFSKNSLCGYLTIESHNFLLKKQIIITYLKKENIFFNLLGVKNKNNFMSYKFFTENLKKFTYNFMNWKKIVLIFYINLLNYYLSVVRLYFIFNFSLVNINNTFVYKCLR